MGYGDLIMAAGQAQELYAEDPGAGPIAIVASDGKLRWRDIWEGNPAIYSADSTQQTTRQLVTGKGHLPYIRHPYSLTSGWQWSGWRAQDHRGSIYLSAAEYARGLQLRRTLGPYCVVEPTADRKHPNRRPPSSLAYWQPLAVALRAAYPSIRFVQLHHPEATPIPPLHPLHNTGFRDACAILSGASLLIATEGGLAHAAAALGIPALVLWTSISPEALGYPEHQNLWDPEHVGCGRLVECASCAAAWQAMTPSVILDTLAGYSRWSAPVAGDTSTCRPSSISSTS